MKQVVTILLFSFLLSCTIGADPEMVGGESVEYYMATPLFYGQTGAVSASAAAPFWRYGLTGIRNGSMDDYPFQGHTTVWNVTEPSENLYRIHATTSYDFTRLVSRTDEVYYIKDVNGNGLWDFGDYYSDQNGIQDPLYRELYSTEFSNGDIRTEEITADSNSFDFQLPEGINEAYEYASKVEYTQMTPVIDVASSRVQGARWYVNTGEVERIYIYETGTIVNPVIDGKFRGRSDLTGEIIIVIDSGGVAINGFYEITNKDRTWRFEVQQ